MKQKKAAEQPTVKEKEKEPIDQNSTSYMRQCKFDVTQKSWLGPKTNTNTPPTVVKQRIATREKQMKQQDHTSIKINKKKLPRVETPNLEDDDCAVETDGNTKEPLPVGNQPSRVDPPQADEHREVSWSPAIVSLNKNPRLVTFERPMTEKTEHFMSTNQQIQRLESEIRQKDHEISLLRQQLFRSHRENDKLVDQLKMYSGADYKDVVRENEQMKDIIQRMHRHIIKLEGEKKRDDNTKLQQIKYEEELEELHLKDWYHPTSTAKDEEHALNTSLSM